VNKLFDLANEYLKIISFSLIAMCIELEGVQDVSTCLNNNLIN